MTERLELVRYDENHWVLHLDADRAAALLFLLGRMNAQSEPFGPDDWNPLCDEFFKHEKRRYDAFRAANQDVDIVGTLRPPVSGTSAESVHTDLFDSVLWRSFEHAVPEDRKEEVMRELQKAVGVCTGSYHTPLAYAFQWSASPQGHDYWAAWSRRADSPDRSDPPPVMDA